MNEKTIIKVGGNAKLDYKISFPDGTRVAILDILSSIENRRRFLQNLHKASGLVCDCQTPGVPVRVGRRQIPSETYYLYPPTRADRLRHREDCPLRTADHRRPEPHEQGGETQDKIPVSGADDSTDLIVHIEASGAYLTKMMEWMWSSSLLNARNPKYAPRDYDAVRKKLLLAAATVRFTNNEKLTDKLLIPQRFTKGKKEEINLATKAFAEHVSEQSPGRWGVIIAKARTARTLKNQVTVAIAHTMLDLRISTTTATAPKPGDIIIARVSKRAGENGLTALEWASFPVTEAWIPANSEHERTLLSALEERNASYVKPLPTTWQINEDIRVPNCILRYHEQSIWMFIDETHEQATQPLKAHRKTWRWNTIQSSMLPELPS
jgi:hypothetical protein